MKSAGRLGRGSLKKRTKLDIGVEGRGGIKLTYFD
jgi:hypothetical protein